MKQKFLPITLLAIVAISVCTCKKAKIKNRSCADDAAYFFENDSSFIALPNIFTPNNDGVNDVFQAFGKGIKESHISVSKSNLSKTKVFESTDPAFMWDGKFKGKAIAENIYKYSIEVVFISGKQYSHEGTITLVIEKFSGENCSKCAYGNQFNGKKFDLSLPPDPYAFCN